MENNSLEINNELQGLKQDKVAHELELKHEQNRIAQMLRNEMGADIDNVLSGKICVKESKWDNAKFKTKCFFDKLFNSI